MPIGADINPFDQLSQNHVLSRNICVIKHICPGEYFYGKKNDLESLLFQQHYATIEAFLAANHIEYSDKRNKGGALWVVDSPRARLAVMRAEKLYDVKFDFTRDGGRSSKRQAAWYLDSENIS